MSFLVEAHFPMKHIPAINGILSGLSFDKPFLFRILSQYQAHSKEIIICCFNSCGSGQPVNLQPRSYCVCLLFFSGFKCPVCSKFVSSDEMDLHLVLCLTKPRVTYNGRTNQLLLILLYKCNNAWIHSFLFM